MSRKPPNAAIAEEVRARIGRLHLTQTYVAKRTGMTTSTLSRRLTGESEFTVTELYRLAEVFGIPVSKLMPAVAAA